MFFGDIFFFNNFFFKQGFFEIFRFLTIFEKKKIFYFFLVFLRNFRFFERYSWFFFGFFWIFLIFYFIFWFLILFFNFRIFFWILWFFGIPFKVNKVTTKSYQGYYWASKIAKNGPKQHKKLFFSWRAKKASAKGRSPPQELEVYFTVHSLAPPLCPKKKKK